MTLEEKIEEERAALTGALTPVTLETFNDWKKRKAERKQKELEDRMKEEEKKAGSKGKNILSGKALFKYDPTLFKDDEDAADEKIYEEREEDEDDEEEKKESYIDGANDMIKSSVNGTATANGDANGGDAQVDADLFKQENVGDEEEEEPDFD